MNPRTLVISDLHLGQLGGISVLELARPLERLLESLAGFERLVLLGDIVELQEVHSSASFPVAEPILRSVGAALGPDREVLLLVGNHDHGLLRDWSLAQGRALAREAIVPADASVLLRQVVDWLAPAHVEVRYPGVWLTPAVWATHGHYLNHYLRPVSSVGVLHPWLRVGRPRAARPCDYEYIPSLPAGPHLPGGLPRRRWEDGRLPRQLAPLMVRLLAAQMRRSTLPAMASVASALGVHAEAVIFGHVHRRGPLAGERADGWRRRGGALRLLNTGAWRYEPVIMYGSRPPHPYWPGGAVTIDRDGALASIGMLDDFGAAEFR